MIMYQNWFSDFLRTRGYEMKESLQKMNGAFANICTTQVSPAMISKVNQQPPTHHPLEPITTQLGFGFNLGKLSCKR